MQCIAGEQEEISKGLDETTLQENMVFGNEGCAFMAPTVMLKVLSLLVRFTFSFRFLTQFWALGNVF